MTVMGFPLIRLLSSSLKSPKRFHGSSIKNFRYATPKQGPQHSHTSPQLKQSSRKNVPILIKNKFPIAPEILQALNEDMHVTTPNEVQQQAWGPIIAGKTTLLASQTGTGKTLAYALPILKQLVDNDFPRFHTLCLVPTRELAIQVQGVFQTLVKNIVAKNQEKIQDETNPIPLEKIRLKREGNLVQCVVKGITGSTLPKQIRKLERNQPSIIVATPKQLLELLREFPIYDEFKVVVLDETDKLLDPLPKNVVEKKRMQREKRPKPTTTILDFIVYQKEMSPNDDRRLYQHLARTVQIVCASASLTSRVKRELVQRGWVHPKNVEKVMLSDGRSLPEGLQHFIVDDEVCAQYGLPHMSAQAAGDQGDALFHQLHWTIETMKSRTTLVFVPTSVPVAEVVTQLQAIMKHMKREIVANANKEDGADRLDTNVAEESQILNTSNGPQNKEFRRVNVNVLALYDHVHAATSGADAHNRRKDMVDLFANATEDNITIGVVSMDAVRGIDIPQVDLACMVGTPRTPNDYLHAVGRVARNNASGVAVTIAYDSLQKSRIQNLTQKLNTTLLPLQDPSPSSSK
eukprot:m.75534 g.75534  ORF g.75534 m.75534 type:complete len:575 (-) comp8486_c0_seq5:1119-2843(-)